MLKLTFAEQLIVWRTSQGMTQRIAAHALNTHVASLNAVERGRRDRLPREALVPNDLPADTDNGPLIVALCRRRLRLKQERMAEVLGVHVYRLRCWESGVTGTEPPAAAIARCLELVSAAHSAG